MKVEIIFFKESSGKYYSSCEVDIPEKELDFAGSKEAIQTIVNYQNALREGWQGSYTVFTRELEDKKWWTHLYKAERFEKVGKMAAFLNELNKKMNSSKNGYQTNVEVIG